MIMTSRTTLIALFLTVAFLTAAQTSPAVDVYTDPVGFVRISATNTLAGNCYTAIGLPLQRMKADQGLVAGVTSNTISGGCTTCSSSSYWDPNSLHYVEFVTGNAVGRYFAIQTNTDTTITLAVGSENLTGLTSGAVQTGDRYVIRPFWRIRDIFGDVTNTPLQAAANQTGADNVLLLTSSGAFSTIFPKLTSTVTNWIQIGAGTVNNLPILPDEGMFVLRRSGSPTNLILVGEVRTTNSVTVLDQGYNFIGNAFPASIVITNSQLLTAGTGFLGGANSGNSDNILLWDPPSGAFVTVFYKTNTQNWVAIGVGNTNNLTLEPGVGYIIQNKTSGGLWSRSLPYNP